MSIKVPKCPSCAREGTTGCPYPRNTVCILNCDWYWPKLINGATVITNTQIINSTRTTLVEEVTNLMQRNIGREHDKQIIQKINSSVKENHANE